MENDSAALEKIKVIRNLAAAMEDIARIGAHAYANGYDGNQPIVAQHFTPGNYARQGWAPLSQAYAKDKAKGLSAGRNGKVAAVQKLSTGRRVKVDSAVPFTSNTGTMQGFGSGTNLPMLVASGALREAVAHAGNHRVMSSGNVAYVVFSGLPDYATYLHEGTAKMPKRSPVEIAPDDRKQLVAIMQRIIKGRVTGQGGAVAQSVQPGNTPRVVT